MPNVYTRLSVLCFAAIVLASCGGGVDNSSLVTLDDILGDNCDNPDFAAQPGNNCRRDVDDDEMTITRDDPCDDRGAVVVKPPHCFDETGDDRNREYIPTWFTCANESTAGYGYGACIEYLLSTRSLQQQFMQSCRNGPGRFLGDGQLCYGIYGRPAFGGTSPGCQIRNSSGTEIRYELYDENSHIPTREEYIASCRARGGTLR